MTIILNVKHLVKSNRSMGEMHQKNDFDRGQYLDVTTYISHLWQNENTKRLMINMV